MCPLKKLSFKHKWSNYIWQIVVFWTLFLFVSSFWNIMNIYKAAINDVNLQAAVAFDKDVQYRRWNAQHGGVYVPVSKYGKSNPYLEGMVKHDIITQDGDRLTMINPAYMTRQVHESELSNIGVKGHITSLNLVRPENVADEWETKALQAFDNGLKEISSIEVIDGDKYFRFMKPLMTEKSCLKCHEKLGSKIGEVRGGISISIPIESMLQKTYVRMISHGLVEGLIGIIGLVGILFGYKTVQKAEGELEKHREHLEELVAVRTSELQEQNVELDFQRQQIEEANRLKSEFLSNMSHELRTPLNSILLLSNVLIKQTKDKLNDEENDYLKIVERNGEKLLELINDILDLSKIESGKADISLGEVPLGTILRVIKENLTLLAEEKGLTISLKIPKKIPKVKTDEAKLYQVFTNVISNAVKFTEVGSVDIIVNKDSKNVYVAIKDTGIGIYEDSLQHIFDEFRQVDGSTTRKYEGTGLGLTIANKTMKLLGGNIQVKSELDKGSVFTISIPIKWVGRTELIPDTSERKTEQKK